MIGGDAPMVMAVMWVLTAIIIVFVVVRIYTRAVVLHQTGVDDYVYCLSGICLFFYTLFMHISSKYGFGQEIGDLELDDAAKAIYWEMIGQTFAVIGNTPSALLVVNVKANLPGMSTAKVSLGLFLLRIVVEQWHRVAIWIASLSLFAVSVMTAVLLWTQCIPAQAIFDIRVDGRCIFKITPFSIVLGSWCAAVDFFFAGFPWVFIWSLQMKKREKRIIAGSMSLGVLAGACGIVRTIELVGMSSSNYTKDTVSLIVWSAGELAVTMVCIGIPVLRPLYRRIRYHADYSSERYYKQGQGSDGSGGAGYGLNNMDGQGDGKRKLKSPRRPSKMDDLLAVSYIGTEDNKSDEEILGAGFHQTAPADGHRSQAGEDVESGESRQAKEVYTT